MVCGLGVVVLIVYAIWIFQPTAPKSCNIWRWSNQVNTPHTILRCRVAACDCPCSLILSKRVDRQVSNALVWLLLEDCFHEQHIHFIVQSIQFTHSQKIWVMKVSMRSNSCHWQCVWLQLFCDDQGAWHVWVDIVKQETNIGLAFLKTSEFCYNRAHCERCLCLLSCFWNPISSSKSVIMLTCNKKMVPWRFKPFSTIVLHLWSWLSIADIPFCQHKIQPAHNQVLTDSHSFYASDSNIMSLVHGHW